MADKRLYQEVAEKIIALIESGEFPVGSRLPGERDLAERFGVSRVSVREAEISLQAKGLLDVRTGSGVYVLEPPKRGIGNIPDLSPFELTEARALFEGEAAALAATLITDEELDELRTYVDIMSGRKNGMTAEDADEAFHRTIAGATRNTAVIHIIEELWRVRNESQQVQSVYSLVCTNDAEDREAEHQEILDALIARKPKKAREAMRQHFARLLEALLKASEEAAYQEVRRRADESRARFLQTPHLSH